MDDEVMKKADGKNVSSTSYYVTAEAAQILLNRYGFRDAKEVREIVSYVVGKK
jgi:hypothetical protein